MIPPYSIQENPRAGHALSASAQPEGVVEQSAKYMYGELGGVVNCAEGSLTSSALAERG